MSAMGFWGNFELIAFVAIEAVIFLAMIVRGTVVTLQHGMFSTEGTLQSLYTTAGGMGIMIFVWMLHSLIAG